MDRREVSAVINQTIQAILSCDLFEQRFIIQIHLSTLAELVSVHSYASIISKFNLTAGWLRPSSSAVAEFYYSLNSLTGYGI